MKKKILIGTGITVAVILLIVAAILIFKAPPMLSHPQEELISVKLTTNPWLANLSEEERGELSDVEIQTIELAQKADMYTTHHIVENSTKRKKIKLDHEGIAHNPAYEVIFTYADGTSDRIFPTENGEYILRCINPDATIDQQVFIKATCPDLAPYIAMFTY